MSVPGVAAALRREVEVLTGIRVTFHSNPHPYDNGITVARLAEDGTVAGVRPGSVVEWALWRIATTPMNEWSDLAVTLELERATVEKRNRR